jgi:hypothetical protein
LLLLLSAHQMSEELERHVIRRFEICQRLGKGVSTTRNVRIGEISNVVVHRPTALYGRPLKRGPE